MSTSIESDVEGDDLAAGVAADERRAPSRCRAWARRRRSRSRSCGEVPSTCDLGDRRLEAMTGTQTEVALPCGRRTARCRRRRCRSARGRSGPRASGCPPSWRRGAGSRSCAPRSSAIATAALELARARPRRLSMRGVGEVRPQRPAMRTTPCSCSASARVDQARPVFGRCAVAAEPGVDLQVDDGGTIGAGGERSRRAASEPRPRDRCRPRCAAREVGLGAVQPGQQRHGDTRRRRRTRPAGISSTASEVAPASSAGAGERQQPVAVGVGFDGEHQLATARPARRGARRCAAARRGRSPPGKGLGDRVRDRHAL